MAAVAEATPVAQVAEAQLVAAHVVVHAVDAAVVPLVHSAVQVALLVADASPSVRSVTSTRQCRLLTWWVASSCLMAGDL